MQALAQERAEAIVLADLRPIWLPGPEDIVIDHQTGWAYVASQARPPGGLAAIMRLQGAIYGLDLKLDRPQPINITDPLFARDFLDLAEPVTVETDTGREPLVRPKGSFHPGGISLFSGEDGSKRLFAVNRRDTARMTVEIFDVSEDRLTHLRTVADNTAYDAPLPARAVVSKVHIKITMSYLDIFNEF